jgi:hypothetical protein
MTWGPWIFTASKAVVCAVLLANAFGSTELRAAWLIAAVGVGLNFTVIAANGGFMPLSDEVRVATRGVTLSQSETTPRLTNVKVIDESTRLAFLGDVVPQPAWFPRANVVSIGDVLLATGLGLWAFQVTLRVRRHPAWHSARPAEI